jgi:iron complex outermembrane receptor protein
MKAEPLTDSHRTKAGRYSSPALVGALLCAAWVRPALAAAPAASGGNPKALAEMSLEELMTVKVSPFEVSTNLDDGYRASNSVSASRFDAPIGRLPFALQAFTESFIADQKPVNIFDVARYAPGVTYRSNDFNEGNANLAIRGFAVSSTPGNVQILRDGFHGPSIFDFTNVARVEVVKGPASFLYGQVAPGGIVNIITKTPQPQLAATARATYGSYGEYRFESDVTGPAIEKRLFYRLATSYDEDMHYWKPYDAHSFNISPSLLARPNDRLSLSLKFEHYGKFEDPQLMQKPGRRTQNGVVPTPSDPNLAAVDVPGLPDNWNSMSYGDFRRSNTNGFSAWADFEADDHWNVRAGYSHQDYEVDALATGSFGMANNTTFLQGRRVRSQTYSNRGNTIEAQAVGKYQFKPISVRLLVGAEYVSRRFDVVAAQAPNDPALGEDPTASPLPLWDLRDSSTWNRSDGVSLSALTDGRNDRSAVFKDRAVYGGVTFGLFDDRLLLLAGWRQTWTDSHLTERQPPTAPVSIAANQLTPQYGALYELTHGLSVFSSYAESFVPGSQVLLVRNVPTSPATATKGYGVEAGVKFEPLAKRVSGTLTYFDIRNRNIVNDLAQLDPTTGVMLFTNVQSGEQRSQGIELDTTLSVSKNWQVYLSYSYMDARIVELLGNDAAILAQDPATLDAADAANYKNVKRFHGAPLQMSAPHLANLWSRYDFPEGALEGFYLAGGANLTYNQTLLSDTPASANQTYTLVGATVGYIQKLRSLRIILDLTGKNLANQHYRPSQSTRSRPRELLFSCSLKL